MTDVDIRNYKCVPLDILRNIGKDNAGQDVVTITSDNPTLKDFKEQQAQALALSQPSKSIFSGDQIENIIVGVFSGFIILIFVVILFWGYLNLRTKGLEAFALPTQLRSLPVLALFSIIFAVIGFLIGWFSKR